MKFPTFTILDFSEEFFKSIAWSCSQDRYASVTFVYKRVQEILYEVQNKDSKAAKVLLMYTRYARARSLRRQTLLRVSVYIRAANVINDRDLSFAFSL